jgi:hypothetical protein
LLTGDELILVWCYEFCNSRIVSTLASRGRLPATVADLANRPRQLVFLTPIDSQLNDFLKEIHQIACFEPSIVERIDQDLDLHAKKKKLLRLVDEQFLAGQTPDLPKLQFQLRELKLWLEHLGLELPPASTLSDNLNAVSNSTRSLIHQVQLRYILHGGLDDFQKCLIDSTAVAANTERPTDSTILVRGHCLALTLLGSYLTDAYHGDIRRRDEVSARLAHDLRQGAHVRKVMESYQTWFGEGPEPAILRMFGLFDRPADEQTFGVLLKSPAIPGLTESLTDLHPTDWQTILAKLRRARLLAREDPHNPGCLDTHPLVSRILWRTASRATN